MTSTAHFATASTWPTPANITQARAVVAGENGLPYTDPSNQPGGTGAVVSAIIPVSGTVTIGVGSIAGGTSGNSYGGNGGRGSQVGTVIAAGGGGQGSDYYNSTGPFKRRGNPAVGPGDSYSFGDGSGASGGADGSGGVGGVLRRRG